MIRKEHAHSRNVNRPNLHTETHWGFHLKTLCFSLKTQSFAACLGKQYSQLNCNVTLWCVRETIITGETKKFRVNFLLTLTHWGRVTQICVFTLQLWKTDDANLRFLTRACFPCIIHLIMQYIEPVSEWSCLRMFIENWPHSELNFRHGASSI